MIEITAAAARRVRGLQEEQAKPGHGLRVGVKGGGCSGLTYVMQLEPVPRPNDRVFEAEGIRLFVDPKSYIYLKGSILDYASSLMASGFKFRNPNAKRTCGCGESFAV